MQEICEKVNIISCYIMHIKMALRCHHIPARTASQTNAGNDTEEKKLLHTTGGNIHQYIRCGNQHRDFFKEV